MIELAKANNPTAEFEVMDSRSISGIDVQFDAIICGFCLPYLSMEETEKLFSDASTLLKPGGTFYISTMEDKYSNSGFRKGSTGDEIYMHYYMEDDLTKLLSENNFKIVEIDRKLYPGPGDALTTDLILIAVRV
jgi:cyclopropane fatty-acyl-phospholipid synthase-like methyltransferase